MKKCCTIKKQSPKNICPSCGKKGIGVKPITLHHLIKRKFQHQIQKDIPCFFCKTKDCKVVYFSLNNGNFFFEKSHIRVRIGQKEKQSPVPLCYCFDYTQEDILQEIRNTEKSTATEEITQKIKDGLCACEIRNPEGRCCLGNITSFLKSLKFQPKNGS